MHLQYLLTVKCNFGVSYVPRVWVCKSRKLSKSCTWAMTLCGISSRGSVWLTSWHQAHLTSPPTCTLKCASISCCLAYIIYSLFYSWRFFSRNVKNSRVICNYEREFTSHKATHSPASNSIIHIKSSTKKQSLINVIHFFWAIIILVLIIIFNLFWDNNCFRSVYLGHNGNGIWIRTPTQAHLSSDDERGMTLERSTYRRVNLQCAPGKWDKY